MSAADVFFFSLTSIFLRPYKSRVASSLNIRRSRSSSSSKSSTVPIIWYTILDMNHAPVFTFKECSLAASTRCYIHIHMQQPADRADIRLTSIIIIPTKVQNDNIRKKKNKTKKRNRSIIIVLHRRRGEASRCGQPCTDDIFPSSRRARSIVRNNNSTYMSGYYKKIIIITIIPTYDDVAQWIEAFSFKCD